MSSSKLNTCKYHQLSTKAHVIQNSSSDLCFADAELFIISIDHRNVWTTAADETNASCVCCQFYSSLSWHSITRIEDSAARNCTEHCQVFQSHLWWSIFTYKMFQVKPVQTTKTSYISRCKINNTNNSHTLWQYTPCPEEKEATSILGNTLTNLNTVS